jgi:predicted ATPase
MSGTRTTLTVERPDLVGRDPELARLEHRLSGAISGRGAMVAIVGEPGIGKTRVTREFMERARIRGVTVLQGRGRVNGTRLSYAPLAEALTEYVRSTEPQALQEDLPREAGPILRLVPAIIQRLPGMGEPAAESFDQDPPRLFDAVTQFLTKASARAPIVMALDDLQWAGRGTIEMLRHLVPAVASGHVLIVGAYRDAELRAQFAEALDVLGNEPNYECVLLGGLPRDEIAGLVRVGRYRCPENMLKAIEEETKGNPSLILQALVHLAEADIEGLSD